jgi:hypothetical protein
LLVQIAIALVRIIRVRLLSGLFCIHRSPFIISISWASALAASIAG